MTNKDNWPVVEASSKSGEVGPDQAPIFGANSKNGEVASRRAIRQRRSTPESRSHPVAIAPFNIYKMHSAQWIDNANDGGDHVAP